jgi:hypothetical protein
MVRGRHGGRRWGSRGGGMTPPVVSTPKGSNPQGDEQVVGQEKIVVGDVVGMMRSFQWMSEALINRLDRDEARVPHPLRFHCVLWLVLVAFTMNSRRSNLPSSFVPRTTHFRGMVREYGDVLCTSRLYLQHEGPHGDISTEGECSFMVEESPATTEHGC